MRAYIAEICKELQFPAEASASMLSAWDAVAACPAALAVWQEWIGAYEKDIHLDYVAAQKAVNGAAQLAGVHAYTSGLLYFLCLTGYLKKIYAEQGIDLAIWHDSCMDLTWKLLECHKMYGIWGSFVAWWFPGFFDMTRFALGRLQFELMDFPESFENSGRKRPEGFTKVINVHIPSSGRLNMEECEASYRQAAAFFADAFPGDRVMFHCDSWLLYPPHKTFLKPDSGIVQFMSRYEVFDTAESDSDLWRIYNRKYEGHPGSLPEGTGLQRAYKGWLCAGNHAGNGEGFFYMKKPGEESRRISYCKSEKK